MSDKLKVEINVDTEEALKKIKELKEAIGDLGINKNVENVTINISK